MYFITLLFKGVKIPGDGNCSSSLGPDIAARMIFKGQMLTHTHINKQIVACSFFES